MNTKEKAHPIVRLQYQKGDLVIKQGDYGISIYKIIRGRVIIFNESENKEIHLGTLGPGDLIGEMSFLSDSTEARSLSARAVENSVLEVWHPATLSKEYELMSPVLKYIINQTLKRLMRMNKVISKLSIGKELKKNQAKHVEPVTSKRNYYRKLLDQDCFYRPFNSSLNIRLSGKVKDLSFNGLGLIVGRNSSVNLSHKPGKKFQFEMTLPNGKELDFVAQIVSIDKNRFPGSLFLGMAFVEMTAAVKKKLGFYLMP